MKSPGTTCILNMFSNQISSQTEDFWRNYFGYSYSKIGKIPKQFPSNDVLHPAVIIYTTMDRKTDNKFRFNLCKVEPFISSF